MLFRSETVAEMLGISEAATKSRLARARAMLRDRMERHVARPTTLSVI